MYILGELYNILVVPKQFKERAHLTNLQYSSESISHV